MDLTQNKLTKSEWQSIEIPVSEQEMNILRLIQAGFSEPDIKINHNLSMLSFLKMTSPEERNIDAIHVYLFNEFFAESIRNRLPTVLESVPQLKMKNIKKKDMIRIENMRQNIVQAKKEIFEFVLINIAEGFFPPPPSKRGAAAAQPPPGGVAAAPTLYTLIHLLKSSIHDINPYVLTYIHTQIEFHRKKIPPVHIVMHSPIIIEQNPLLIQYADLTLFPHQKQLFNTFNQGKTQPCLVLYTAPTGTGKTLSPIGLAQGGFHIIFVCSARHVGLSLAKSAISLGTRVAFAYGCNSAEDIRLHNFAAVDYTTNKRSGGIGKVDNTNGSRVEIMISDVKSYLIAMKYMLEFHAEDSIILYWDEPTITMDYEEHELHPLIHRNWEENRISKVVLSCATLPKQDEIQPTLDDFLLRFIDDEEDGCSRSGGNIVSIISHDCKKSITLLAANQFAVLPHLLFTDFRELIQSVEHCMSNKTLLRYFDLAEIVRFFGVIPGIEEKMQEYFPRIEDITMTTIKNFYLEILGNLDEATWPRLSRLLIETQRPKYMAKTTAKTTISKTRSLDLPPAAAIGGQPLARTQSIATVPTAAQPPSNPLAGIMLTTEDAHTLTDGPTLYIAEDVEKIGKFLLSKTPIPATEMSEIQSKIAHNNVFQRKITILEKQIEDELGKEIQKEKKMEREQFTNEVRKLKNELEITRANIVSVVMSSVLVPNTEDHQDRWCGGPVPNAFRPSIQEEEVVRIMGLDVEDMYKILLLLGIGTFVLSSPPAYLEIMKQMAQNQKLFLILASSDYIYGTNYQFCHSIIGKDLLKMTPQKTIQALGRVGRNNIQQEYTVRFRNEEILRRLFLPMERNLEAENMSRLWGGGGHKI